MSPSHYTRKAFCAFGAVLATFGLLFLPVAAGAAETSRTQEALELHACADDLGLNPADEDYSDCVRVLDRSLMGVDATRRIEGERASCSENGLQPGSREFAVCVAKAALVAPNYSDSASLGPR